MNPGPPWVLVATVHTHPFSGPIGSTPGEVLPDNCGQLAGTVVGQEEYTPAPADRAKAIGKGVPGYVVSPHFVTRFDAHLPQANDPASRPGLTSKFRWYEEHGCRWADMRPPPSTPIA